MQDQYNKPYTRVRAIASGRVQGVGYRMFVMRVARELGIRGYVRNQPNGDVLVYAVGERFALEKLLSRLRDGPVAARVDDLELEWGDADDSYLPGGFEVLG